MMKGRSISVQSLGKYQQVLQKMIEPTGTRQSYRRLTRILQHMLIYPGGGGTVQSIEVLVNE